jgi:hypothetical protein
LRRFVSFIVEVLSEYKYVHSSTRVKENCAKKCDFGTFSTRVFTCALSRLAILCFCGFCVMGYSNVNTYLLVITCCYYLLLFEILLPLLLAYCYNYQNILM